MIVHNRNAMGVFSAPYRCQRQVSARDKLTHQTFYQEFIIMRNYIKKTLMESKLIHQLFTK